MDDFATDGPDPSSLCVLIASRHPFEWTAERHTRYLSRVDRRGPDECWPWTASGTPEGYGQMRIGARQNILAHRVAYALAHGAIPPGRLVLHRCDNPGCNNPAHLFLGTDRANSDDKIAKGRHAHGDRHGMRLHPERVPRGERSGLAKLTTADVLEILNRRAAGVKLTVLAAEYGIAGATVSGIARGRIWRHVYEAWRQERAA